MAGSVGGHNNWPNMSRGRSRYMQHTHHARLRAVVHEIGDSKRRYNQRLLGLGASLMTSSNDVFNSESNLVSVSLNSLASFCTRDMTCSRASLPLEAFPAMDDVINCSMYDVSGTPCTVTMACCVMSVFAGSSGCGEYEMRSSTLTLLSNVKLRELMDKFFDDGVHRRHLVRVGVFLESDELLHPAGKAPLGRHQALREEAAVGCHATIDLVNADDVRVERVGVLPPQRLRHRFPRMGICVLRFPNLHFLKSLLGLLTKKI